jgi:integrase/recombinase XerD
MLQEVVDDYITSLSKRESGRSGKNQNTILAYRNDLNQLCAYMMRREVETWSQATGELIVTYLLDMREEQAYRPATIARKLAAFKSFFRYMLTKGLIDTDPIEHVKSPPVQKDLPHALSAEQINGLFREVDVETIAGKRDIAMLHVLYATGMRSSELVSLNLDDFDVERAIVFCPGSNRYTKRERTLPLSLMAKEALQHYLQAARPQLLRHSDEPALFLNHHGERLTRQGFWLIIKGYARRAGITEITPHMLRHSFALLMLREGMELRSVQELLGHAHISSTQVYSQLAHARTEC